MKRLMHFGAVLALIVSFMAMATAAFAAPTASPEVCVGLQGSRDSGQDEPLTWELRDPNTTTVRWSPADGGTQTAIIQSPPGSFVGCFTLIGQLNQTYDLWIKGDNTNSVLVEDYVLDDVNDDLSSTVTLPEGDADGDNAVGQLDLSLWKSQNGSSGSGFSADFDQDDAVGQLDLSLWKTNNGDSGPARNQPTVTYSIRTADSTSSPQDGASMDEETMLTVIVQATFSGGDSYDGVQIDLDIPAPLQWSNVASTPPFTFLVQDSRADSDGTGFIANTTSLAASVSDGTYNILQFDLTAPAGSGTARADYDLVFEPSDPPLQGTFATFQGTAFPFNLLDAITITVNQPTAVAMSNAGTSTATAIVFAIIATMMVAATATLTVRARRS